MDVSGSIIGVQAKPFLAGSDGLLVLPGDSAEILQDDTKALALADAIAELISEPNVLFA
jgi:hypothetical protein